MLDRAFRLVPSSASPRIFQDSDTSPFAHAVVVVDAESGQPTSSGGYIINASATFTRPADVFGYSIGDLVANSTTAGSVAPMSFTAARVAAGSFMVRRARLSKTGTSTSNASFRLHLFLASPTVANGDNGVFSSSGSAGYIGALDVLVDQAFTDGAAGASDIDEMNVKLSSGQVIYGLLEARGAYTPASAEGFTAVLEVIPN